MSRLSDAGRAMDSNSVEQSDGLMLKGFPALSFTLMRGWFGVGVAAASIAALAVLVIWLFD